MPSLGKCVTDYWVNHADGTLKYTLSSNPSVVVSTTTKNLPQTILNGWDYNSTTGLCTREKSNNELGLENGQYTYMMALTGLLIGFSFLFPLMLIFSRR